MLKQVKAAYPEAIMDVDGKGVHLRQSPPPIRKRLAVLGGRPLLGQAPETA